MKKKSKRILAIIVAAFFMALNIKTFVRTGELYPGGATGVTILIQTFAQRFLNVELPYTLVNLCINAVPIYIGFRFIGKKFTGYSCLMIVLTSVFTDLIPAYSITYDTLLIAIFGGIINGTVISLCLSVGATTGGTDFISIYLSEKKDMDSWNIILAINIVILSIAGFLFGWDKALYSIIFQYASTQVLHTLYKKYQKDTLFIVTDKPKEICDMIYEKSKHGATIISGKGGFEQDSRKVVYSVVSRQDTKRIMHETQKLDEKAFINAFKTEELSGWFYKEPQE